MPETVAVRPLRKGTTLVVEHDPSRWDLQVANLLALDPGRAGPLEILVVPSAAASAPVTVPGGWTLLAGEASRAPMDSVGTERVCFVRAGTRLRWDALDVLAGMLLARSGLAAATGDSFVTDRDDQPFVGHIRCGILHRPETAGGSLFEALAWEAPLLVRTATLLGGAPIAVDSALPWVQRIACLASRRGGLGSVREFLFLERIGAGSGPTTDPDDLRLSRLDDLRVEGSPLADDGGVDLYAHLSEGPAGRWTNVLTVTFNRLEYTRKTIEGLLETAAFPHGILVVDNASIDGTREYLLDLHRKGVVRKVLLLDRNVGLARGINIGWKHEKGSSFLLKLDNDMVFQRRGWLEAIVEASDRVPQAAVLGYNVEPRSYPSTLHAGIPLRVKADANVGGGCVFLSNATRDRFGYFCEDYGLYGEEDGDLGLRVRLEGFLNAYMDDEDVAFHLPSGKAGAIDPKTLKAIDPMEMEIDPEYRLWKDEQRANLQRNGGILQRNIVAYHSGQRSRWVPTGEFMGLLGDLQVFDDVDAWCFTFHPRDGRLLPGHEEAVAGWASSQGHPARPRRGAGHGREWLVVGRFDPPAEGVPGVVVGPEGILYEGTDPVLAAPKASVAGIGVSIVIPVHGHLDLTRQCVDSVRATTDAATTEIVVVDDASPDDTAAWLRGEEAAGRLVAAILPSNKGFSGACNAGAAASSGSVLVFLNNDTICLPGWLDAMLAALDDPAVGLVGSRLLYEEGDIQHAGMRMLANGLPDHEFRHAAADDPRVTVSRDRPFVTGACIALSRRLYEKVGGFDEGFRMYVEDLDLCMKVWNEGLRVRYAADSVVYHLECRTMKDPERRTALVDQGLRRLYDRWMDRWPDGLLKLPDWPAHFRRGFPLRWAGPMLRKGGRESYETKIVEFLERHLHGLQVHPFEPDPGEIEWASSDEKVGKLWRGLLGRERKPAILVVAGSVGRVWASLGRPRGHATFLMVPDEIATGDDLQCVRASGLVWACGPETAARVRATGIDPAGILELPRHDDPDFSRAMLLAVAVSKARLQATGSTPEAGDPRRDSAEEAPGLAGRLQWCAPILNYSGYARMNRDLVWFLERDGIRPAVTPMDSDQGYAGSLSANPADLAFWREILARPETGKGLHVCSYLASEFPAQVASNPAYRAHVGLTMFETDRLPAGWAEACASMDEIWVPSAFNRETFVRGGVDPARIRVVPYGMDLSRWDASAVPMVIPGRRSLNLLAVFEWTLRKGWDILVEAFATAFGPDDDVSLTLRTRRPATDPAPIRGQIDAFLRSRGLDPRRTPPILLLEEPVPDEAMASLYAACDAVVLPTRGEGWGLPFMEAMAMERPVVATAWGAHMDFLDEAVGWTIPVEALEPVDPSQTRLHPLYGADHRWARPSLPALVGILRQLRDDPAERRRRGLAGRARLASDWTPERSAAWIRGRAEELLGVTPTAAPRVASAPRTASDAPTRPDGRDARLRTVVAVDARTLFDRDSTDRGIGHYSLNHLQSLEAAAPDHEFLLLMPDRCDGSRILQRFATDRVRAIPVSEFRPEMADRLHLLDPMGEFEGAVSPFEIPFPGPRSTVFYDLIPLRFYLKHWPRELCDEYMARLEQAKAFDGVHLCISEATSRDLQGCGVPASRTRVIGAGLNTSDAKSPIDAAATDALLDRLGISGPFFLHVGALDAHKNFQATLSCFLAVKERVPCQLVVVGRRVHSLAGWAENVEANGIQGVVFTDFLPREELEVLYARAISLLFLSRIEGFGFPLLEAMAQGCPGIAYANSSLPEVGGDAAILVPDDDEVAVVKAMLALLAEPGTRSDLSRRGRERAAAFPWSAVAERTLAAWARGASSTPPTSSGLPEAEVPVLWGAPVFDPSGYADEARGFLKEMPANGISVALREGGRSSPTFRAGLPVADRNRLDGMLKTPAPQGCTAVVHLPAHGFQRIPGCGHHVGRTMFETDSLPASWVDSCNAMDEIWVPTDFNLRTFREAGVRVPLLKVHGGVDSARFRPGLEPVSFPGRKAGTTYLSVFEWTARKGWDVLLEGWARAFKSSDDVRLVIRAYPPNAIEGDPAAWVEARIDSFLESIGRPRATCAPIVVLAAQVPDADMPRLYAAADVYLAPSRGEGWGRPHMEAMSCGVPVVATAWSGNLEFQDEDNSWLIPVSRVAPVGADMAFEIYRGQSWAEPDTAAFVELLQRSWKNRSERVAKAARARADVVARWDWKRVAPRAALRLREIAAGIPAERSSLRQEASLSVPPIPPVRWCGPLFNFSGYARLAREAVAGLMDAHAEITADPLLNDPEWFDGLRHDASSLARWKELLQRAPREGVLVACDVPVSADGRHDLLAEIEAANPGCSAKVAWTMFETDRLPAGWAAALNRMDQVWVPSRTGLEAFRKSGVDPSRLRLVPGGVDPSAYDPRIVQPAVLPGPVRATTFLSVFQWGRRKGWDTLLEAWARAFGPGDDVRLVLRCHGAGNGPGAREQLDTWLREAGKTLADLAPIVLLEEFVPEPGMAALYAACDVFVLPSRGEGWGLPFLEAMASGKPCIATAWGGHTDFLHEGVAWMLPVTGLVAPGAAALSENPFLTTDHRWAEVSVESLVEAMRSAQRDPAQRERKGRQAREEVVEKWTRAHVARAIAAALGELPSAARPGRSLAIVASSRLSGVLAATARGLRRSPTGSPAVSATLPDAGATAPEGIPSVSLRWEGSQFLHHSLAHVNRALCLGLAKAGHDLSLIPYEPDQFGPGDDPDLGILASLTNAALEGPCQVHVRHQWPPNLQAPAEGRWVVIQPWEFGSPPVEWVRAWKDTVDDLWAYTTYVRDMYVRAGMPADRVHVVPLGVDVDRFRPGLAPLAGLPAKKVVRFLFVGGTIARKGFDRLLNAWQKAFGPADDVELVIKDMGGSTTYKGQTGESWVRKLQDSGNCAPIHYFDQDLPPDRLPSLYAAADVLVHPFRGEGFGLPIAEAMACGLPVVATAGGSADDFCGESEGWMIPSTRVELPGGKVGDTETVEPAWWLEPDEDALVAILRRVAADPAERARRGAAARRRIVTGFTWAHAVEVAQSRLATVVSRPARRSGAVKPPAPAPAETPSIPGGEEGAELLSSLLLQVESAAARREFAEADSLSKQAVEEHPGIQMAWIARAMVLRGMGRHSEAMKALVEGSRRGEGPETHWEMLQLHLLDGKTAAARTAWNLLKERHGPWLEARRMEFRRLEKPWPGDKFKAGGAKKASSKSGRRG